MSRSRPAVRAARGVPPRPVRAGRDVPRAPRSACVSGRPEDTSEEAWAILEEGLRRMTPEQRVSRAVSLTILSHRFALAQIRADHPEETDRQHRLRLAARMIDPATMKAAFGWVDDGS